MSLVSILVPLIEAGSVMAAGSAVIVNLLTTIRSSRYKRKLEEIASTDRLVSAELNKFFRDQELSDAEVRAISRALKKAILRGMEQASQAEKVELYGVQSMVSSEVDTRDHRLFKELAVSVSAA